MKPLERGRMTGLVEIPANWYLDDLPPMVRNPYPSSPSSLSQHFNPPRSPHHRRETKPSSPPNQMFIKSSSQSHGWVNPKTVEELWRDHFDYFYREYDDFVFPVTVHPDVAGHPHVIFMLERSLPVFSLPSSPFPLLPSGPVPIPLRSSLPLPTPHTQPSCARPGGLTD